MDSNVSAAPVPPASTPPGWYRVTAEPASPVRFWDGEDWVGTERRAGGRFSSEPRDSFGIAAFWLFGVGVVSAIGLSIQWIVTPTWPLGYIGLALMVASLVISIIGLVRARRGHFHAPQSLAALIVNGVILVAIMGIIVLAVTVFAGFHI